MTGARQVHHHTATRPSIPVAAGFVAGVKPKESRGCSTFLRERTKFSNTLQPEGLLVPPLCVIVTLPMLSPWSPFHPGQLTSSQRRLCTQNRIFIFLTVHNCTGVLHKACHLQLLRDAQPATAAPWTSKGPKPRRGSTEPHCDQT